jgi:LPXTG-motif cell wall-anchored protein
MYIGEDLFDNYYVVIDYDTNRIGLAGFTTKYVPPSGGFPIWAIILIAIAGVAIIGGGVWFVIKKRKEKAMNSTLRNYNQLDH